MIENVGDENGQNRHQHLKVVTDTFRLQHRIVTNIDVALLVQNSQEYESYLGLLIT